MYIYYMKYLFVYAYIYMYIYMTWKGIIWEEE